MRDHLGHRRLRIDLVGDVGGRGRARHRLDDLAARRVVPDAALGRAFLGPSLELAQRPKARDVVAMAGRDQLLDRLFLPQVKRQALRCRLVRREFPDAPERGLSRVKAPLRALGRREMPALLGDFRRVAHRHRPGRGRVEDQRRLARDQRLVVRGIVPGEDVGRQERHQPLHVVENLLYRLRLDRGVAVLVDELGAVSIEQRAEPVRRVAGLAEREAKGVARFLAFLGGRQEEIPGPLVGQLLVPAGAAGRVHLRQIEPDGFLENVDPPDRR